MRLAGNSLFLVKNSTMILERFSIENNSLSCAYDNSQLLLKSTPNISYESAKFVSNQVLIFGKQNNLSFFQTYDKSFGQVGGNVNLGDQMENFTAALLPGFVSMSFLEVSVADAIKLF